MEKVENSNTILAFVGILFSQLGYNVFMARPSTISRYSRLAPASAVLAGALHSASSRMGHHLELALASELVDSEVALPWSGYMPISPRPAHRFAMGRALVDALGVSGIGPGARHAMPDLWFISADPASTPSYIVQIKSGGRIGKSQRSGEASSLLDIAARMDAAHMPALAVFCAFDAQTDKQAISALGQFDGIQTLSGPSLCLLLGIDYDRVVERWEGCAGNTLENDQILARGLYASMVEQYGERVARRVWQQAADAAS